MEWKSIYEVIKAQHLFAAVSIGSISRLPPFDYYIDH